MKLFKTLTTLVAATATIGLLAAPAAYADRGRGDHHRGVDIMMGAIAAEIADTAMIITAGITIAAIATITTTKKATTRNGITTSLHRATPIVPRRARTAIMLRHAMLIRDTAAPMARITGKATRRVTMSAAGTVRTSTRSTLPITTPMGSMPRRPDITGCAIIAVATLCSPPSQQGPSLAW